LKYYLIAGEASGDMHGSNLMKALKQKDAQAQFRFWGGHKMQEVGGAQVEHYKNTAFMGFWEVITHLRTILRFIKRCKQDIIDWKPDVLILIDYPGFNLRIAEFAKQKGFKVVYYISPQIWAWKENRIHKIKSCVDKMLVILPFEKDFYKKWNYEVDFVGHPLIDEIKQNDFSAIMLQKYEKPIVAVLPGSRKQEIKAILPQFLKLAHQYPQYQFIVAGLSHIESDFYQSFIKESPVTIIYDKTYTLLANSHAALVASGTATLETALFKVPMLVGYKGSFLSYHIGKMLVKVKYIALVNLIMDEPVIDELIQYDLNNENLQIAFEKILNETHRKELLSKYNVLEQKLGGEGASANAADVIFSDLNALN
jgi:lipid-A-disaccharide synthase